MLDADQDADADGPPSFVKLLGLDGTKAAARAHAERALAAIAGLPNADALRMLAQFTVDRPV